MGGSWSRLGAEAANKQRQCPVVPPGCQAPGRGSCGGCVSAARDAGAGWWHRCGADAGRETACREPASAAGPRQPLGSKEPPDSMAGWHRSLDLPNAEPGLCMPRADTHSSCTQAAGVWLPAAPLGLAQTKKGLLMNGCCCQRRCASPCITRSPQPCRRVSPARRSPQTREVGQPDLSLDSALAPALPEP